MIRHHQGAAGDRAGHIGASLLEHGGGFTGDRRFIHRRHAVHHLPIGGDEITLAHEHLVAFAQAAGIHQRLAAIRHQTSGLGAGLGAAQGIGLGLAATFRQGFRQVGEQQGGYQDCGQRSVEAPPRGVRVHAEELGAHRGDQGDERAAPDHEHHRVAHGDAGIQLSERFNNRPA